MQVMNDEWIKLKSYVDRPCSIFAQRSQVHKDCTACRNYSGILHGRLKLRIRQVTARKQGQRYESLPLSPGQCCTHRAIPGQSCTHRATLGQSCTESCNTRTDLHSLCNTMVCNDTCCKIQSKIKCCYHVCHWMQYLQICSYLWMMTTYIKYQERKYLKEAIKRKSTYILAKNNSWKKINKKKWFYIRQ